MNITSPVFQAYLECPTKCFLRARGEVGTGNEYANWVRTETESYRHRESDRLVTGIPAGECIRGLTNATDLKTAKCRLALDVPAQTGNQESEIHAVETVPSKGRGKATQFIPIRFVFRNKLTTNDKLLLAYDASVLSGMLGRSVPLGKIIHGDDHSILKVKTATLHNRVGTLTEKIGALLSTDKSPDLVLNRHCGECEFQTRCRQKAVEKDDLSLLSGMSEKERTKLNSKGIFTVTQLSYTFRPRRRPKKLRDKKEKYHHSLKALAIREKKIHIVGTPELKIEGTPVYFDVEGLPDRDFYYLIGVRVGEGESAVQHSLWADTADDERRIWQEFLTILDGIAKPVLIHYGSYETTFLRRMRERYGGPPEDSAAAKTLELSANVVSTIFARIYFPTHSNSLKEVASWLGFSWSDPSLSGLNSIAYQSGWESLAASSAKQKLVIYNAEDCAALELVTRQILELRKSCAPGEVPSMSQVVQTASMKREHPYGFKSNTFAVPNLEFINKAAYWDYQRERIYVKSSAHVRLAVKRRPRRRQTLSPNKTVVWPRPDSCPKCKWTRIHGNAKSSKTMLDLKFVRHGIKRWVTKYLFGWWECQNCGCVFCPDDRCWTQSKYGAELIAYSLYQAIDLRLPLTTIARSLNKLFDLRLSEGIIRSFKANAAEKYRAAYNELISRLCVGELLHADETKIGLKDREGFVWIFGNMKEVAYVYSETREGDILSNLLKDFKGVLVSDFYAAYDGTACPQQKCLIHLIRDLNDAVLKHPYDEELKGLVTNFADLVKPMVETVDRNGLKRYFLRKHRAFVDRFYKGLAKTIYQSDAALKCKERFEKNRNKLFTFLDYDGVPWNNNNAEHAIKAFAMLRRVIEGISTPKGIEDYLVLLSICQTCKYQGLDFLDFLRSGERDIEVFAQSKRRKHRLPQPQLVSPSE